MNSLAASSRSVLPRLGRLLHRYKPAQPKLPPPPPPLSTPRQHTHHHLHTVPRGSSRPEVLLDTPARRWYRDPRKVKAAAAVLLPFAVHAALTDRETVPYTNRAHRVVLSPASERELGDLVFETTKKDLGDKVLGPSDPRAVRVRLIAADLIRGVHRAFSATRSRSDGDDGSGSSHNDTSSAVTDDVSVDEQENAAVQPPHAGRPGDGLNWEVIVVEDDYVYARSVIGGKIVVSTRLLEFFKTDAEIAAILAHEVGHAVARHLLEFHRILEFFVPSMSRLLPFAQWADMEADAIGVMLLGAAGFDPRVAPGVYEGLGEIQGNSPNWGDYIGSRPSCKKRSRVLWRGKAIKEASELYYKHVWAGEAADRRFPYGGRSWETRV